MRISQVPSSRPNALPLGEMRFVAAAQVPDVCTDLAGRKFLVVGASAGPLAPAGLRRRIDDAVEGELAARGALPAAIGVDAELASCIRDQVFRTRALGTTGLAIALPPLFEMADADGRLNMEDSAALLAWTRATAELPVVLLASEADRQVSAYAPMPLERLLASEGRPAPASPPPAVDEATWLEASREPPSDPFDMTPPPAAVSPRQSLSGQSFSGQALSGHSLSGDVRHSLSGQALSGQALSGEDPRSQRVLPPTRARTTPAPPPVAPRAPEMQDVALAAPAFAIEAPARNAKISLPDARPEDAAAQRLKPGILKGTKRRNLDSALQETRPASDDAAQEATRELYGHEPDRDLPPVQRSARSAEAPADLGAARARKQDDAPAEPAPIARAPKPEESLGETATVIARARETNAARVINAAEWRNQALELDAARGPKPVRVIEQLFMTRYVPLVGALARNEADGAVRSIVDGWAQAFEHSYVDAFSAMRVTGKRPMMTFDAPEIATRIARLNGARGVKLLLVDAMSYDLGERVSAELRARATANGVCVDRMLLWSALPTTTPMQLALIARGPDALRDVEPPSEPEHEISRGRAVATLRRERLGTREVMKLDLVEARLRNAGPAYDERLDAIADEVATVLCRYLESLPPRTLLFVFGDHGFKLPKADNGRATGPATQGGASPEEVLVPAYAWLSGGVH
jgi:hypothetical protein